MDENIRATASGGDKAVAFALIPFAEGAFGLHGACPGGQRLLSSHPNSVRKDDQEDNTSRSPTLRRWWQLQYIHHVFQRLITIPYFIFSAYARQELPSSFPGLPGFALVEAEKTR